MFEKTKIDLGKKITEIRKIKNISQEKLGEISGLHRTYVGSVERGERNISIEAISKICKALGIKLEDLFKGINIK
jgi:transcriptional regulator with XRE-family HTH domain